MNVKTLSRYAISLQRFFFSTTVLTLVLTSGIGSAFATSDSGKERKKRQFDFWVGEWNVQNKHLQPDGNWKKSGKAVTRNYYVTGQNAVIELWE